MSGDGEKIFGNDAITNSGITGRWFSFVKIGKPFLGARLKPQRLLTYENCSSDDEQYQTFGRSTDSAN